MTGKLVDHSALPERAERKSEGDPVLIDAIGKHLGKYFGVVSGVLHDDDSRWVHLDLHVLAADEARPVTIVCTSGMAERPLKSTAGARLWTELMIVLPGDWPLKQPALGRPESFWPFSILRWLARFPHRTGTGFTPGESIGPIPRRTDLPPASAFDAALFLSQDLVPNVSMVGREVEILAVCPIHLDELAWIREHGSRVLRDAFAERGVDPLLFDPTRPSFAPAR